MSLLREYIKEISENIDSGPIREPMDIPIPRDLQDIHRRMKRAGRELFLVGGAVRDALMGKTPKDYDVATNASPEEVIKILQRDPSLRLDLTGKQFGVVRVKTPDDGEYEIATFREDIGKGKNTSVKFSNIENDVKRRDLTINALFYDMDSREVVDYVGGIKDIESGVIRAVGDPAQRFDEDRIRILRAIRFAGRMGSDLDSATKNAILEDNDLIDTETGNPIPADRITEEFIKGLKSSASVSHFISLVDELGLFDQILPGLEIEIRPNGTQDHIAQIAALLKNNPPDLVVPTLKRMRYSNDESKTIRFLLELMSLNKDKAAELKKSFNRLNINPEHLHNFAEASGFPSESAVRGFLEFAAAPPVGNAKDLMAQGLKGPEIGKELSRIESEAYLDYVNESMIRKIILEALTDIVVIKVKITTDTRGENYFIGDILTDIRGLQNVITANQLGSATRLNSGAERYDLAVKFENDINVDIPTLEAQLQSIPGIKRVDIISVDEKKYTEKMAKKDYLAARSKKATDYSARRKTATGAFKAVSRFEEANLRNCIRSILREINLGSSAGIEYTALILDNESHQKLASFAPSGWNVYAHHMTIINPPNQKFRLPSHWLDFEGCVKVHAIAQNDYVVTALVDLSDLPIPLKGPVMPHVTIAVNQELGGKPRMSNDIPISEFKELNSPIYICGKIKEIFK